MKPSTAWRLAAIVALSAVLVFLTDAIAAKQAEALKQLDLLVEVRHELVNSYVEEPDQLELIESAVQGMVDSLEDPYTVFVPSENYKQFSDQITGSFSGIGAEIDMLDGRPRIVTPLEDSPAWKAGIMAGDIILDVDGETTQDLTQREVISRIKGEVGTDVILTVRRETGEELDITITRAKINLQTVRGARRQADMTYDFMLDPVSKVGYVRLSQFTNVTAEELRKALTTLHEQDAQGLIIDVRFDPGGLLDAAVEICDMFLTEGQRIVSTKGRKTPEVVYDSTADTIMPDIPIVILANEGSASASEVLTGALSDNDRALFVGTRTFGKGSVQHVRELQSGLGALKLTGAYYYLPSGRNIHKKPDAEVWGVDPDEGAYVPMNYEEYEAMLTTRRDSDAIRNGGSDASPESITPEYVKEQMKDPQLAAALTAILGKLDTGDWPKVGDSHADQLVKERERAQLERRRTLLLEELEKVENQLAGEDDTPEDATTEERFEPKSKATEEAAEPTPEPAPEADVAEPVKQIDEPEAVEPTEPEAQPAEPEAEAKPQAEVPTPKAPETPAPAKADPKPSPQTEPAEVEVPDVEPEPVHEAQTQAPSAPATEPEAETPKPEAAPEAEVITDAEPEVLPEAEPAPAPDPEQAPETEPKAESETEVQPQPENEPAAQP